jgi:hypothetical protein
MTERRINPRMLCADLVEVEYRDKAGRRRKAVANLEDISLAGACLQMEQPLNLLSEVRILHAKASYPGKVRYCVFREIGYFVGIEFEPGTKWSQRQFRPQHMLDPRRLVGRAVARATQDAREFRPL